MGGKVPDNAFMSVGEGTAVNLHDMLTRRHSELLFHQQG